jgi:hypothetical protein
MMGSERPFTEIVQIHEQKWGEFQYPGRPSLNALLSSPVVAVWGIDKRFILSTHFQVTDLNELILAIVMGNDPYKRRLLKIFENHKPIDFKTVIQPVPTTPDKKSYKYPDRPEVIDTNPQREMKDLNPYVPPYIPQPANRVSPNPSHINNAQLPKPHHPKPGIPIHKDVLPGRKVSIIRTHFSQRNKR